MKRLSPILLAFGFSTFLACSEKSRFPEPTNLSEYKQTEFLPTLEHPISSGKNAVYGATMLFAWDEIRKQIKHPIQVDRAFSDLNLLNNSKSYIGVLQPNEYFVKGDVSGETIRAHAEFSMSLPFEHQLTSFRDSLIFDRQKVASFGQVGYRPQTTEIVRILYYQDDDNFIIKLSPKDKNHEIILFKTSDSCKTIKEIVSNIAGKIETGNKEKLSGKNSWRYFLTPLDLMIIPKLRFNIQHNYPTLEGKNFKAGERLYSIMMAYQRNAFILDESGAEVESIATMETASSDAETEPQPKIMKFDKPFFLMLKRSDTINPYFALWINNAELLLPEK